ncbi:hypothetical protein RAC89_06555 [Paenibacillus sp. GD4]|nr:hypothetical protein [Paenibacillus sp. GD4]MDQ1910158.1 hypothetical protein [Paenibacillus sp. GD4]
MAKNKNKNNKKIDTEFAEEVFAEKVAEPNARKAQGSGCER